MRAWAKRRVLFQLSAVSCALVGFLVSQFAHRASKGFAMGATTKSISGLFVNACVRKVCDRNMRKHDIAGHGTRSAVTQGYLSLTLSWLRPIAWPVQFSGLVRSSGLRHLRDQARWLLNRLEVQLSSALPRVSGALSPARFPASSRLQPVGTRQTGVQRFPG
jgi:hypothetical protein